MSDATQALRDTENALRDFISSVLSRKLGSDWVAGCGVSAERIARWAERKAIEVARQPGGVVEERLIYYADFYDLHPILKKHWNGEFSSALGDWKTMDVYLAQLQSLRDPSAHGRDLLPHQRELILGITGEIRGRLVRYRSKRETAADCFPRFESVRDSLGNVWTAGQFRHLAVNTEMVLRPGDAVDFAATARDPDDGELEFAAAVEPGSNGWHWQSNPEFRLVMTTDQIGEIVLVRVRVRSLRDYHASVDHDDEVTFMYTVLPGHSA